MKKYESEGGKWTRFSLCLALDITIELDIGVGIRGVRLRR